MICYIHSELEMNRSHLTVDENTDVENFETYPNNKKLCREIFDTALKKHNYQISHNQMCNGINRFLKSRK